MVPFLFWALVERAAIKEEEMKISAVMIHNYKSICSEKRECCLNMNDKVTFLIGANESGKTNILESMRKFSEGGFKEDDIPYESKWFGKINPPDNLKMISVTYKIEDDDKKSLQNIHTTLASVDEITLTRCYRGQPRITSPKIETDKDVNELISQLKKNTRDFSKSLRNYIKKYKRINKADASPTRSTLMRLGVASNRIMDLKRSSDKAQITSTRKKVKNLRDAIETLSGTLGALKPEVLIPLGKIESSLEEIRNYINVKQASDKIWDIVPTFKFVPADPSLWLVGEYVVDDIINKPEDDEELVSVRRLLSLAELDIEATKDLREGMQSRALGNAGEKITEEIRSVWEQERDIKINLEWSPIEGNKKLLVMVESAGHIGYPQLRSLGFRWFIEFYLVYAIAQKGNVVLLFEEPGIQLHPDAQESLKKVMRDKVASKNQVVYTTHLPGMYDLAYPEGCRAIEKDDGITKIEDTYSPEHQYATWEVAMRAMGMSRPMLQVYSRCIIVEGTSDWVYLLTFAQLLAKDEPKLSDLACGFIHIRHYQGASGIVKHIQFHFQPGARSVVLLDSDEAGERAERKLRDDLHLPNEFISEIVMLNKVGSISDELGEGNHELEDVFGADYYIKLVNGVLDGKQQLKQGQLENKYNLLSTQAVKLAKQKFNVVLRKDDVAWHFRESVKSDAGSIPEAVSKRFKLILTELVDSIGT